MSADQPRWQRVAGETRTLLRRTWATWTSPRRMTLLLAALAGLAAFVVGETVFPYYTSNHDEAVYLQQAAMLLEGQLFLHPPVVEPFRPWFFVVDGGAMYSKYTPVTAAIFAVGGLFGDYRLALAGVAAATVALTYAVVAEVFDGETGVVAAVLLVLSPLFLVQVSVFLPYVPAFCLNLCFAWAYLRADRTGSVRFAALAGLAVALSFWARPYTAILFATPFICHALWSLRGLGRNDLFRQGTTAALGLCGVAAALGYNAVVTGDPLLFPYEAFAPRDGLGFGHREIVGYERDFTPALSLRANARNLLTYVTRWTVAGSLGAVLAVVGLGAVARRGQRWRPRARVAVLAGVALSIVIGNLYFWGTLNLLAEISDPTDGLISFLGPFYHVGLLLPTAAFGAVGARTIVGHVADVRASLTDRRYRGAVTAVALAVALVATGATAGALSAPLEDNYEVTEQYEQAYEPFEDREFENAVVFLPTPYGDWLNHPFQALRNDPGYDGDAVYALQEREFAVVDAYPERTLYRYAFRGEWVPYAGQAVEPTLRRIEHVSGERVRMDLSLGVPPAAETVEVRASVGEEGESTAASLRDEIDVTATVENGTARVNSSEFVENVTVPVERGENLRLVAYVDYGSLGGFEYVAELPLRRADGGYRALSPYLEVCRVPTRCGGEAAYVPGTHRDGVEMNASVEAES